MSYCPNCGAKCDEDTVVCSQCGYDIGTKCSASIFSNEQDTNPYEIGAQSVSTRSRYYDPVAPEFLGFGGAITTCFKKYFNINGRATRSEFWYWLLFVNFVNVVLRLLTPSGLNADETFPLSLIWLIIVLLPSVAVGIRRLHDLGHSGLWYVLVAVPLIGHFILLIWFCQSGSSDENKYGPAPQPRSQEPIEDSWH